MTSSASLYTAPIPFKHFTMRRHMSRHRTRKHDVYGMRGNQLSIPPIILDWNIYQDTTKKLSEAQYRYQDINTKQQFNASFDRNVFLSILLASEAKPVRSSRHNDAFDNAHLGLFKNDIRSSFQKSPRHTYKGRSPPNMYKHPMHCLQQQPPQQYSMYHESHMQNRSFHFCPEQKLNQIPKISGQKIVEVWADNLEEAFQRIQHIVDNYHYVAIDTEFPGVVAIATDSGLDYRYKTVKCNVDILNLIQLGITFANEKGEFPEEGSTWQFNFKFDLETDLYAYNAIQLLCDHGIDFHTHQKKGIDIMLFGELIMSSGLVMSKNMKWISFHGCYDFGYLLKSLTCTPLPDTEQQFFHLLHDYFPSFCDIKCLLMNCSNISHMVSLEKAAGHCNIERYGHKHQAGSDSLVTCQIFFKLRDYHCNTQHRNKLFSNILYGLRNRHSH